MSRKSCTDAGKNAARYTCGLIFDLTVESPNKEVESDHVLVGVFFFFQFFAPLSEPPQLHHEPKVGGSFVERHVSTLLIICFIMCLVIHSSIHLFLHSFIQRQRCTAWTAE